MTGIHGFSTVARALSDDLRVAIDSARSAKLAGLQVDAITRALDLTSLSTTGFREIARLFSSHNLRLIAVRCETGSEGFGPKSDTDRLLDRADGVLRSAAALGCESVCVDLGRLPPASVVHKPRPKVTKEMAGLLILPDSVTADEPEPISIPTKIDPALLSHWQQAMSTLGDMADRYGVSVAFSSQLSSLAALVSMVSSVRCPWFGYEFDTVALLRDDWSIDDLFTAVATDIRQVRARDAIRGEDRRTKPAIIGRGDVAWRNVLNMLKDAAYHGAITLDPTDLPDPAVALQSGIVQLKALSET